MRTSSGSVPSINGERHKVGANIKQFLKKECKDRISSVHDILPNTYDSVVICRGSVPGARHCE